MNLLPIERSSKSKNDFSKMLKFMHVWEKFNKNNDSQLSCFQKALEPKKGDKGL